MPANRDQKKNLEITVYDGKYTVIQYIDGSMEILRYGQPWTGTENQGPIVPNANVVLALASEIESLRTEVDRLNAFIRREQRAEL